MIRIITVGNNPENGRVLAFNADNTDQRSESYVSAEDAIGKLVSKYQAELGLSVVHMEAKDGE